MVQLIIIIMKKKQLLCPHSSSQCGLNSCWTFIFIEFKADICIRSVKRVFLSLTLNSIKLFLFGAFTVSDRLICVSWRLSCVCLYFKKWQHESIWSYQAERRGPPQVCFLFRSSFQKLKFLSTAKWIRFQLGWTKPWLQKQQKIKNGKTLRQKPEVLETCPVFWWDKNTSHGNERLY